jgi:hypothetical protein
MQKAEFSSYCRAVGGVSTREPSIYLPIGLAVTGRAAL